MNLPNEIVAFILVGIQEAVVEGCLVEGLLPAARGRGGSAQGREAAPGRLHGGQRRHRHRPLAGTREAPGGHDV